jgi:two-component system sensor histidine kinase BaeS
VVQDDGQGVAEDELTRIFDRLYRTDRSRRQGSMGLGLSIVREIALIHGGWVQAEAVKPRGLRVMVQLDATPKQAAPV